MGGPGGLANATANASGTAEFGELDASISVVLTDQTYVTCSDNTCDESLAMNIGGSGVANEGFIDWI